MPSLRPAAALLALSTAATGCYFDFSDSAGDAGLQVDDDDGGITPVADAGGDGAVADAKPGKPDADTPDAAEPDASEPDAAEPDAGTFVVPTPPYTRLSETGLYADITTRTLHPEVVEYQPVYKLWSDGAAKRRFVYLPPGTQIDTSNMDRWRYPTGTMVWKEFRSENPNGDILLETRLVQRTGPAHADVYMISFRWLEQCFDADPGNDGECDAIAVPDGAVDVNGTTHDIPSTDDCSECHDGERHQLLSFAAIQLSHGPVQPDGCEHNPGGLCPTLITLADDGLLTDPPPPGTDYPAPGTGVTQRALGYLHANCGHCHTSYSAAPNGCYTATGGAPGGPNGTGFHARLYVQDTDPTMTEAYLTSVNMPLVFWSSPANGNHDGYTTRVVPGSPEQSALYYRVSVRNAGGDPPYDRSQQMPPIATDVVDPIGAQLIAGWIEAMQP